MVRSVRALILALFLVLVACGSQAQNTNEGAGNGSERGAGLFDFDLFPSDKPLRADQVIIYKSLRRLDLLHDGKRLRSYRISLGGNPLGHKQQEGDSRTPEGDYKIDWRNPKSKYHLSLHISYPDKSDKASARKRGVSPGGDIMIHGLPNGWEAAGMALAGVDWTDGCIAVDNWAIKEIWDAVPNGTPISILP